MWFNVIWILETKILHFFPSNFSHTYVICHTPVSQQVSLRVTFTKIRCFFYSLWLVYERHPLITEIFENLRSTKTTTTPTNRIEKKTHKIIYLNRPSPAFYVTGNNFFMSVCDWYEINKFFVTLEIDNIFSCDRS